MFRSGSCPKKKSHAVKSTWHHCPLMVTFYDPSSWHLFNDEAECGFDPTQAEDPCPNYGFIQIGHLVIAQCDEGIYK